MLSIAVQVVVSLILLRWQFGVRLKFDGTPAGAGAPAPMAVPVAEG